MIVSFTVSDRQRRGFLSHTGCLMMSLDNTRTVMGAVSVAICNLTITKVSQIEHKIVCRLNVVGHTVLYLIGRKYMYDTCHQLLSMLELGGRYIIYAPALTTY